MTVGLYPVFVDLSPESHHRLTPCLWPELEEQHKVGSLRSLAREYSVSHEAGRRALLHDRQDWHRDTDLPVGAERNKAL